MNEHDWLAERFEEHRPHLRAVATRLLGSTTEADDALQEGWMRLSRSDVSGIDNLGGWLTTVVARVCLNMLQSRRLRREDPANAQLSETITDRDDASPEQQAILADSVGLALLVVMHSLTPAERLAFVLHDMFAMPFDEIAPIVERSPAAARQLASRARRRVHGATLPPADPNRQREIITAFLAASREGDFDALMGLLATDAVLRADEAAVDAGASAQIQGAVAVANSFLGRTHAFQPALVNGTVGAAAWAPGGRPRAVFTFTINNDRVTEIQLIGDPDRLRQLHLAILNDT
jgi:RNA polymerase sigma factor (sigma-70 family)